MIEATVQRLAVLGYQEEIIVGIIVLYHRSWTEFLGLIINKPSSGVGIEMLRNFVEKLLFSYELLFNQVC